LAALAVLTGLAASGCGSGGAIRVKGTVTNNGQPLSVSDKGMVQVIFIPDDPEKAGDTYPANVNPDGTFEVPGKEGKGIPPGKYRVAVRQLDPYPTKDKLKDKFSPEKTPIVRDVASREVNIDIANVSGS
jgi:hypothetical protein